MKHIRPVLALLCSLWLLPAWACEFPDSTSGAVAPDWVCAPEWPGVSLAAIGSRGHMPSLSTQNRNAGRDAMLAVARRLQAQAAEELQQLGGGDLPLQRTPFAGDDIALLQSVPGIRVYSRQRSPGRTLYVLAGIEDGLVEPLLASHRRAWLEANEAALRAHLGDSGLARLQYEAGALAH